MNKAMGQQEAGQRRLWGIIALGVLCWLGLAGRLVQIQAIEHADYLSRAKDQYERRFQLKAKRGNILDRRGRQLAVDIKTVSFYANPKQIEEPEQVAEYFARFSGKSVAALKKQLENGKSSFTYLARQVDENQLDEVRRRVFKGVYEHPATKRNYPHGKLAGQVLGHTNIDNQGSEGAEFAFDAMLQGVDGSYLSHIDVGRRQVAGTRQDLKASRDGHNVVLTIDALYQDIVEEELARAVGEFGAEGALGIVADPRSGEILAMANMPLYDPNQPGRTAPQLRRNRAITDPFEPGSTFKLISSAAVLQDGRAQIRDRVFCEEGRLVLENGDVIRDTSPHGWMTFREVLERSSNIGTIKFAQRLERKRYYEYMRNFGFGTRSGIGLPAESAGLLHGVNKWSERSLETLAIGQEISVTALQLVQAFGAIANGGQLMAPKIVKAWVAADGHVIEEMRPQVIRRVISAEVAASLRDILAGVVQRGTGKNAGIEGMSVAGKTGTAQLAIGGGAGYEVDEYVVSFIGFLPAEKPELIGLVVVDRPQREKWGSQVAAPVFKRIAERILYLGDGRLAAHRPREASGKVDEVVVPDLRGTTRQVAQFQAEMRGATLRFAGAGDVVVYQEPAPGSRSATPLQVTCVLGDNGAGKLEETATMPRRQELLLRHLNERTLASLVSMRAM
jgi:cell division protein FtsI (penicillin-binding protein 3)